MAKKAAFHLPSIAHQLSPQTRKASFRHNSSKSKGDHRFHGDDDDDKDEEYGNYDNSEEGDSSNICSIFFATMWITQLLP